LQYAMIQRITVLEFGKLMRAQSNQGGEGEPSFFWLGPYL
jgi:hypothetical protein